MKRRNRDDVLVKATASVGCTVEALELRRMLCGLPHELLIAPPKWSDAIEAEHASANGPESPDSTSIVWTNRGMVSDGFAAAFGTSAGAGRAVVDAALDHWERVFTDFNRWDLTTTLQVNISISGTGFGGAAAPGATAPLDGKPTTGSITLGGGNNDGIPNNSNGWYFDPNPNDHAEFDQIINAYAGRSSTSLGRDMYSVVAAEMAHVLGLISDRDNAGGSFDGYLLESSGYVTETTLPDTAEGGGNGVFWLFQGPTVSHLMTSFNSGDPTPASWGNIVHSAGPIDLNLFFSNWQGSEDVGNAFYSSSERTTPSFVMTHVLGDAYDYDIVEPAKFGTFYALLNESTGQLLVRGGSSDSADVVIVSESGGTITVSVDVGDDVPGTGALSGEGDLPPFVSEFSTLDVSSILIDTGDGADVIRIQSIDDSTTVTVNAGSGDDVLNVGDADFDTNIRSSVSVLAGSGNDALYFRDGADDVGEGEITRITPSSVTKSSVANNATLRWDMDELEKLVVVGSDLLDGTFELDGTNSEDLDIQILGQGGVDTFKMRYVAPSLDVELLGGAGDDVFELGNRDLSGSVRGMLTINGEAGSDSVTIDDLNHVGADNYTITRTTIDSDSLANAVAYSNTETLRFYANNFGNTIDVLGADFSAVSVFGGNGNDTINVGSGDLDADIADTSPYFSGGENTDIIHYNDSNDAAADDYVFLQTTSGAAGTPRLRKDWADGSSTTSYFHVEFEGISLAANGSDNTITVRGTDSGCPVTINGNAGADEIIITDSASLDALRAPVDVLGGSGSDTLTVDDSADAYSVFADGYSVTDDSIENTDKTDLGGGMIGITNHTVTYSAVDRVELRANNDSSAIYVDSTAAQSSVTVYGNGGSDQFHVAEDSRKLGDLDGPLTLDGGSFNQTTDKLTVYDDNAATTVDYTYSIDGDTVARTYGSVGEANIGYTGIEQATLRGSGANDRFHVGDPAAAPINIPFRIEAGAGDDGVLLGGGDVASSFGASAAITVVGGAGSDFVQLDDGDMTSYGIPRRYDVTSTTLSKTGAPAVAYAEFEHIDLITGRMGESGGSIMVPSTADGASLQIAYLCGAGSSTITLGSGDLASDLGGDVTVVNSGTGQPPSLKLDDSAGAGLGYSIDAGTSGSVSGTGFAHAISFGLLEKLTLNANDDGNTIDINDTSGLDELVVNGGASDDTFNFYTPQDSTADISINGDEPTIGPGDVLVITGDGSSDGTYTPGDTVTGSGTIIVDGQTIDFTGLEPVIVSGFASFKLMTPNADDVITIDSPASGQNRISGTSGGVAFESLTFFDVSHVVLDTAAHGGTDSITMAEPGLVASGLDSFTHVQSGGASSLTIVGTHTFDADLGAGGAVVDVRIQADATATVAADQHWRSLSIADDAIVRLTTGRRVVSLKNLQMADLGRLDLADGAMVLDYGSTTPLAQVRALLSRGYNGGAWNGRGINSSSAAGSSSLGIGYAEASDVLGTAGGVFCDEPVDGSAVLVRFTRRGDANLDGVVNLPDFNRLASNFGTIGRGWSAGDFNYDDSTNLGDFNALATNFGLAVQ
jgi:hypothetical protein